MHADVVVLEPSFAEGVTLNGSEGGLRVAVDQQLEVSLECLLRITLCSGEELLRRARVVWTQVLPDGCIAGLEYVDAH